jgi:dolichyl-phosphate-mannose--protein O-mannosyl transferase
MKEIEGRAMELKDRSFMWIYISEWLAVTGTLFVTGFLVWTLMVRRRLYRDISVTKARR